MAEDLQVDEVAAEFVIRDVIIGEDYSFLMDAFNPRYLYWEGESQASMSSIRTLKSMCWQRSTCCGSWRSSAWS